jgi:hypothetical protein
MDHQFLEEVVGALFPGAVNEEDGKANGNRRSPRMSWPGLWRISERGRPPGPDGVSARFWKEVAEVLAPRLRNLFDRCPSQGEFPVLWKEGRMVLLPKPGRSPDSPSGLCACWTRLASCWRVLWLPDSSRICPDVLLGYTTAGLAS